MLKFILKIWPALLPITIYVIWVLVMRKRRKKDYIDAEYKVVDEKNGKIGDFSLQNTAFLRILFVTLALIIFSLIFIVISTKPLKYGAESQNQPQKIIVE